MNIKKSIINIIILFCILGGIIMLMVTFFSSSQITYECIDTYDTHVYLQVNTYRPWVSLWEPDYQGTIFVEWEKGATDIPISNFTDKGTFLEFDSFVSGTLTKLSQKLKLRTTFNKKAYFEGYCKIFKK